MKCGDRRRGPRSLQARATEKMECVSPHLPTSAEPHSELVSPQPCGACRGNHGKTAKCGRHDVPDFSMHMPRRKCEHASDRVVHLLCYLYLSFIFVDNFSLSRYTRRRSGTILTARRAWASPSVRPPVAIVLSRFCSPETK